MRIFIYEVRNDEISHINRLCKELNIDYSLTDDYATLENASMVQGFTAVSTLGFSNVNRALLQKWKEYGIKYVSTRSVGYNHIDLDAAKELGIKVCNASYPPSGVADYTIMLILMCLRNYKQALWRGQVNDFSLGGLQGKELHNLTVGVIGAGKIGKAVLKELTGFGCKLLAYNRTKDPEVEQIAEYVSLDEIYSQCDVISLHLPLTPQTYHMINDETIAKMKDGVTIINCARGGLADIEALVKGIESEKIGALGLDVFEGEEGISHVDHRTDILANRDMAYLKQFKNVVMTQHMAFYTEEAVKSMVYTGINGIFLMETTGKCPTLLV